MQTGRNKSGQKHSFPTSRAYLEKRKDELCQYNRKFQSFQPHHKSKYTLITAPNSSVQSTIKSILDSRLKTSCQTVATLSPVDRPKSTQTKRCHDRSSSLLSVIRTQSKCLSPDYASPYPPTPPLRSNFLRKGSSVDKTIIRNILMSKLRTDASRPRFSYCDAPQNTELKATMAQQIPSGLSDVVGVEEMLRMSHSVLGVDFKAASLYKMIGNALEQRRKISRRTTIDEDDSPTLRPIQRW